MEDPLKRNFGLITWRGKNFIAAAAAAAPVHRPLSRPPDYLRRRRNGLTSIFCLASRHTSSGRGRAGGGGLSADFGSCDDFHFSGLIESVSSALAALIEWAYLTDLSAGAELTYLPFAACRGSCSRSEWKESPKKNGMDGPIEFALPLKGGERRKKTDQYRGQQRKISFASHANGHGMPRSTM